MCDGKFSRRLGTNLDTSFELYKEFNNIPEDMSEVSLDELGCKTVSRFKKAVKGCRWFRYISGKELPWLMKLGEKLSQDRSEFINRAWSFLNAIPLNEDYILG